MHTIRLRGPWQIEPLERYVRDGRNLTVCIIDLPPSARCAMPADWSGAFGADYRGRVRYRRSFNRPTGLDSGERVWLVIEPPRSHGHVLLNRHPLGEVFAGAAPGRFDVTALLEENNKLEIIVSHPLLDDLGGAKDDNNSPGGLVGEVRLEIEE